MRKVVGIVDDNPTILCSMNRLLQAAGYDTELFSSGEALLDSAASTTAACLVVDIHLGGMSGIELACQLADRGCAFPIIFMSGEADQATEKRAVETGCITFLKKPFAADLLIEAVERALRLAE
jgi:FixJ family two-component response regulator